MKEKMIIYSVLPRLFDNRNSTRTSHGSIETNGCGKLNSFTHEALKAIKKQGYTHIWFIGLPEHATKTNYSKYGITPDFSGIVKGRAGSPYAIKDYYDIDPDLAEDVPDRMEEFDDLVERIHKLRLKIIIDFVPNHVARQYRSDVKPPYIHDLGENDNNNLAFDPQNNFYYLPGQPLTLMFGSEEEHYNYSEFPAKVSGNDRFTAQVFESDWYETVKLNYGVDYMNNGTQHFDPIPDTWHRMLEILCFWGSKHIDGFRCDMAEMVPAAFWAWAIPQIKESYGNIIFLAEIYNPHAYNTYINAGFDYLYDKVGMYDTMCNILRGNTPPIQFYTAYQAHVHLQKHMLYFMENHDEQRLASDFIVGDGLKARPAVGMSVLCGSNPFMVYFGQTLGERGMDAEGFSGMDGRTSIFDYWSLDKMQRWINDGAYNTEKLTEEEKTLQKFYCTLFTRICKERTVTEGEFFDLCYANTFHSGFNTQKHHAFFRHILGEYLLVVSNFSSTTDLVRINMPQELFEKMKLTPNVAMKQTDLFTGQSNICTLTPLAPYELTMEPHSVQAIKFVLQE